MSSSPSSDVTCDRGTECAGCKKLGRKCLPSCVFAPYFPPQDEDRFSAVHGVFGASSVANLLGGLQPEQRGRAVESLVLEAKARLCNPTVGCVSFISLLRYALQRTKGLVASWRGELAERVGHAAAFQPFDASAAPPAVKELAETELAALLQLLAEENRRLGRIERAAAAAERRQRHAVARHGFLDGHPRRQQTVQQRMDEAPERAGAAAQASWEQAMIQQHAEEAAQRGTGLAFHGHLHRQTVQEAADAHKSSAMADQVAGEQDAMMLHQIATSKQDVLMTAAEEVCYHTATGYDASLEHQIPQPQITARQLPVAAEDTLWDQHVLMIQQAAAATGLTTDRYLRMMMMMVTRTTTQQDLAGGGQQHRGQPEQYASMGFTMDQNMTMTQQQQQQHYHHHHHPDLQQLMAQQTAIANMQPQLSAAAEVAREQDLMMMQQQAAAYAHTVPAGSGSGTVIMPFLPGGSSANADAFLVQQQWQPQPPPPQQQLQTVNAVGFQVDPSLLPLPPSFADLPHHQQNLPPHGRHF